MSRTETEALFASVYDDLWNLVNQPPSDYVSRRVAGLLRLLLLDARPLVHQANERDKLTIRFRIGNVVEHPWSRPGRPPIFESVEDSFDPDRMFPDGTSPRWVALPAFLAAPLVRSGDDVFTLHNVIDQFCHVRGIMHAGLPKDERAQEMEKMRRFRLDGAQLSARTLMAAGRVVIASLTELRALCN